MPISTVNFQDSRELKPRELVDLNFNLNLQNIYSQPSGTSDLFLKQTTIIIIYLKSIESHRRFNLPLTHPLKGPIPSILVVLFTS